MISFKVVTAATMLGMAVVPSLIPGPTPRTR